MIQLNPVTAADFQVILDRATVGYADECVTAGRWDAQDALDHSKKQLAKDLPEGLNTPDNWFFHLYDESKGINVGYVWLEKMIKDNLPTLFIADIEVNAEFRKRGYASTAFTAIEKFATDQNIKRICLHVFKTNTAAHNLYKKLGFKTTGINMLKNI